MSKTADAEVEGFRKDLGPYVVAAENTRMPMIFTDAHDAQNAIVFVNDSFLELTGFARSNVLGHPLNLVLGRAVNTDTNLSIHASLAAGGEGTWEMCCPRADRSEYLAAVYLSPVHDKEGDIRQNFLSFFYLGAHVESLLKQQTEFYALYQEAPGFIAMLEGPKHRFIFANTACKRLVGRDELEGLVVAVALPEIVNQGFVDLLDQVYRTGELFQAISMPIDLYDSTVQRTTTRYLDFTFQPVRNLNNAVTGVFCAGYDVTIQRHAADSLASLQSDLIHISRVNTIGVMATTLAHELNQPLSAIVNYAAGAMRLVDPQAPHGRSLAQALSAIDEASQRASEIIRSLREMTRRGEPERKTFYLKSAVEECLRLVQSSASPHVEIEVVIPDDIAISADRIQIQQVMINLLSNACDAVASAERRDVTLSAIVEDDKLLICVADSGPGVSVHAAEGLFSWFETVKEFGMGLGLSICRTIVEAHGGRIWLERSSPAGSQFCFSIPLNGRS